jgi:hypothetical protein
MHLHLHPYKIYELVFLFVYSKGIGLTLIWCLSNIFILLADARRPFFLFVGNKYNF